MFRTLAMVTGAIVLAGAATASAQEHATAAHAAKQAAIEKEAIELVAQVEEVGWDLRYHTERLAKFTGTEGISRQTHYYQLDQIKALVNGSLRPALTRLTEIQALLPEWKQDSVERMLSSARELAGDANSAYFTKSENPTLPPFLNEEYRQFVKGMAIHADALVKTADAAHAFAAARLKAAEAGLNVHK